MQSPYRTSVVFEEEEEESLNYFFKDIIKPNKYLLNFNEDSHTIFHSDVNNNLWTSAHSSLANILSSDSVETQVVSNEDYITYHDSRSIVFYFPEYYNTYILARFLGVSQPNSITEQIDEVNSILLYLDKNQPFCVMSNGNFHLKIYESSLDFESINSRLDEIEKSDNLTYYYTLRDTLNVNSDIYIPYKMKNAIPTVYVQNELNVEDIDELRNIAENFFKKDIDYIREIVENNGSVIYLYDDKVLKINNNGLLEYYLPFEEKVLERNLYISLETASEFLSSHIKNPDELYLGEIEEIESDNSLGYRFTFKYRIGGLPVIFKNDEIEDFIQLEVFNKHVKKYTRFIREEMNIKGYNPSDYLQMLSAFEVVNINFDLIRDDYIKTNNIKDVDDDSINEEILSNIEDISIAYVDPCEFTVREKLIGVWVLKMKNYLYAFDAYNGTLVVKKEI